jgi:hypothetical protein
LIFSNLLLFGFCGGQEKTVCHRRKIILCDRLFYVLIPSVLVFVHKSGMPAKNTFFIKRYRNQPQAASE